MSRYASEKEIEKLVRAFEACEIGENEFKHRQHLAVAIWYVQKLGPEAALHRMRTGLIRFLEHHDVDGGKYSERVTVFWIERVVEQLDALDVGVSLVEGCNTVVESLTEPEVMERGAKLVQNAQREI
jgi:hypothetical protein